MLGFNPTEPSRQPGARRLAIKLDALRVFVEVANMGNIKDAAAKLGRTPSAVSMALKTLEDNLGGPLFETDRKTKLTALGGFVLETARADIRAFDRSVKAMHAFAANKVGRLDIASVPSVASHLLPDLLKQIMETRPSVEIELRDTDSASVEFAVERGHVELGIAGRPRPRSPLRFTPLFRDRFVLVCSTACAACLGGAPVRWEALGEATLIANGSLPAGAPPGLQRLIDRSRLTMRNVLSLHAMIRRDVGVTILPRLSVTAEGGGVAILDLEEAFHREVGLLQREGLALSPVARLFVEMLERHVARRIAEDPELLPPA